jgi:hypothetical protein
VRPSAKLDILNQDESHGGLGWGAGASIAGDPIQVFRDFDTDEEFQAVLARLQERVGGKKFAKEVQQPPA